MAHALQDRFATMLDARLRATLVTVDSGPVPVFHTKYEGSAKAGAVKVPTRGDMTTGAYDKATGKALTTGATAYITITDFVDEAVNELIDGYEADAVPDNLVADRLDSAGYAGGLALDVAGIRTLEAEGTVFDNMRAPLKTTIYDIMVDMGTQLTEANVPLTQRYAIVSAKAYALMLKDTTNFIRAGDLAQDIVATGVIGQYAGFFIKVSANVAAGIDIIAGHYLWCARVREWIVNPRVVSLDGSGTHIGASAVQGRWVHKHKVTNALAVLVKKTTAAAPALAAVVAAGAVAGNTKATAAAGAGNSLKASITDAAVTVPFVGEAPDAAAAAYVSGADLAAAADQYFNVYEVNASGRVVKYYSKKLVAGDIKA